MDNNSSNQPEQNTSTENIDKLISELSLILRLIEDEQSYHLPNSTIISRLQRQFEKKAIGLANQQIALHRRNYKL